jgi:hypothetical protein
MSSDNPKDAATFRDELPPGCPSGEAEEITIPTICYRLVHNDPPTDDDFRSQRALEPNRDFGVSECRARGLSVFMQAADAARAANRSRNLRGAKVAQMILNAGAGYIKKTGSRSHRTWWPYKAFDVLANCEVIE